jgi:hypothetical protein
MSVQFDYSATIKRLQQLSLLEKNTKPCFTRDGFLEQGTANSLIRSATNAVSYFGSYFNYDSLDRRISSLLTFIENIMFYFEGSDGLCFSKSKISTDDCRFLLSLVKTAQAGLENLKSSYTDQEKNSLIDGARCRLGVCVPILQNRIPTATPGPSGISPQPRTASTPLSSVTI